MAPKKKGGAAKAETPEQLAARRAAAMAMFATSSTPKEPPKGAGSSVPAKAPAAAPKAAPASAEQKLGALDISDGDKKPPKDDVFTDGGDDVRKGAVAYAASTFGGGGDGLAVELPAEGAGLSLIHI